MTIVCLVLSIFSKIVLIMLLFFANTYVYSSDKLISRTHRQRTYIDQYTLINIHLHIFILI